MITITEAGILNAYKNGDDRDRTLIENLVGKDNLKLDITDRVKTMADVLRIQGISDDQWSEYCKPRADYEIAAEEIRLLSLSLNDGVEMERSDTSQYKYYPWHKVIPDTAKPSGFGLSYYSCYVTFTDASIGARHTFKSASLAEYAGKQFISVYERLYV